MRLLGHLALRSQECSTDRQSRCASITGTKTTGDRCSPRPYGSDLDFFHYTPGAHVCEAQAGGAKALAGHGSRVIVSMEPGQRIMVVVSVRRAPAGDELDTATWRQWFPITQNGTWKSTPQFNMSLGFCSSCVSQNLAPIWLFQKFTFDSTPGYNVQLDMQSMDVIGKITLLLYNDSTIIAEGSCPVDFSVYSNTAGTAGSQISFPTGMRFGGNSLNPELSIVNDCRFSRIKVLFPPTRSTWHVSCAVSSWQPSLDCCDTPAVGPCG